MSTTHQDTTSYSCLCFHSSIQSQFYGLPDDILRDNIFPFIEGIELISYFRLVCKKWQQIIRECPFSFNVGRKLGLELQTNEDFWNFCDDGLFFGMERAEFCEIGLGVMECFPYFENLQVLKLKKSLLSDDNSYYVSKLKGLKRLEIDHCVLEPKVFSYISQIQSLKELQLDKNYYNGELKNLTRLKHLKLLELVNCELELKDINLLLEFGSLSHLNLELNKIGNLHAECISNMRTLTFLGLNNTNITILSLEVLYLGFNEIDAEGVEYLVKMKTLKTLILNDNPIGQLGAVLISKLTNLRELNLTNTCMNDKGVEYISKMASLRDLQIGTNHMITKLGALYLSQMKNLQRLSVPATSINDQGVEFLVNLDSLQYLDARGLPLSIRGLETL
ncbi:FBOX domain-containing protein [Naegleria gruberi]|uniref:FBOX domain-containing protein n=1 Tax=Naegleria gruberi TaxID=5762 RepID=D2VSR5_NAEGR|nr:FBOX domain-containing protein [Naegleria gruberi]EFC40240.1 FBOX domain-containing protein [Naegleria gruberi]|eukprot:XP_002672984.1 FBOX domain-containing protein [Naegleria gruberi strain NEG-M]